MGSLEFLQNAKNTTFNGSEILQNANGNIQDAYKSLFKQAISMVNLNVAQMALKEYKRLAKQGDAELPEMAKELKFLQHAKEAKFEGLDILRNAKGNIQDAYKSLFKQAISMVKLNVAQMALKEYKSMAKRGDAELPQMAKQLFEQAILEVNLNVAQMA